MNGAGILFELNADDVVGFTGFSDDTKRNIGII